MAKLLKKTLLINWLYYENELVEFDKVNYLTGKNSSGKSTFIDALQIALLGDASDRNFNRAANDKGDRTLKGYLRANKYDKVNYTAPGSRKGKAFSSLISCEFYDDNELKSFTIGIAFDNFNDDTHKHSFFLLNSAIPSDRFIRGRKAMGIAELRAYIKEKGGQMFDSGAAYRRTVSAKWNIHTDAIFQMLKKAAAFTPITDIKKFITENVCELPDKPDLTAMQENIRYYKDQQRLAISIEKRLNSLSAIHELHLSCQGALSNKLMTRFLHVRASLDMDKSMLLKHQLDLAAKDGEKAKLDLEVEFLSKKLGDLQKDNDKLIEEKSNSDIFKEKARISQAIKTANESIEKLSGEIERVALEVREEANHWLRFCDGLSDVDFGFDASALEETSQVLATRIGFMENFSTDDFSVISFDAFKDAAISMREFQDELQGAFRAASSLLDDRNSKHEANAYTINQLRSGVKDYDKLLIRLKKRLEEELAKEFGGSPKVRILADLLEVSEERWQGAVEGYLNTQKFYLLVEPKHCQSALIIFDKVKRELNKSGYGLVDVGKLRENESTEADPASLAAVVQTGNPLARDYINYLLGRVVRCYDASRLRSHSIALTPEGMLYQGYVARPLSEAAMRNAYIGKASIKLRLERLLKEQEALDMEITSLKASAEFLRKHKKRETFLTERQVGSVVREAFEKFQSRDEHRDKLEALHQEYDSLDVEWLNDIEQRIKKTQLQMKESQGKKDAALTNASSLSERIINLTENRIPQVEKDIEDKSRQLDEPAFNRQEGEAQYAEELKKASARAIQNRCGLDAQSQCEAEYKQAHDKLISARSLYIAMNDPCPFSSASMDNSEFDQELDRLSQNELPAYTEKIKKAEASAFEQFQNDFLSKLKESIDAVMAQVKALNKTLQNGEFGGDRYKFIVGRNHDYADFYDMIMDPDLMRGEQNLFSLSFQSKHHAAIDELFGRISASDDSASNKKTELEKNIELFTDYRTYLHFDIESTNQNGQTLLLSKNLNSNSGGETQTPFYIAILASFAQICRVNDRTALGNTMRLVLFDEAFNKMDPDRIVESIRLIRKMNLQAIISTPPEKLSDIMPEVDRTLLALKDGPKMQIHPWSKELAAFLDDTSEDELYE
ncbi:MAG: AAA family ATPase [Clostridiales bacterium]|jgi:energy-coupling factor transporter ATP-binding protein EcfA2|nr:AAA family ATPase [Clostridiales bacterium]